jgi:hypothetical protein
VVLECPCVLDPEIALYASNQATPANPAARAINDSGSEI